MCETCLGDEEEEGCGFPMVTRLVKCKPFEILIVCAILMNTAVLSLDMHPAKYQSFMDDANYVLTLIFNAEMFLNLVGLGCQVYWADPFNAFDGVIVLVSDVEMILSSFDININASMISAFRTPEVAISDSE